MIISGVNQYAAAYNKVSKNQNATSGVTFADRLNEAAKADSFEINSIAGNEAVTEISSSDKEEYLKHLEKKYGNVRIENIPRDQESLDRVAKTMRGNDVVIAPNILEEMAANPKTAEYYENRIDAIFSKIPEYTAYFAKKGLTFEACGVVVHEDGEITFICGGGDSPERVAEVNKINKAKQEKRLQEMRRLRELAMERAAEERARISDRYFNPTEFSDDFQLYAYGSAELFDMITTI